MPISMDNDFDSDDIMEQVESDIEESIVQIAKIFFEYQADDQVGQVPVKTGRWRFSWNASVNQKDLTHPPVSPQHGEEEFPVPEFELKGNFELGDTIILSNGAPYGEKIVLDTDMRNVPNEFYFNNVQAAAEAINQIN